MRKLQMLQCFACLVLAVTIIPLPNLMGTAETFADDSKPLTGELRLVGSRAMHGLAQRWARGFMEIHPGVKVSLTMTGSGAAAGALAHDEADVAPLTRELTLDERSVLAEEGVSPKVVRIGNGGYALREFNSPVAIYVDARNPLRGLTVSQLATILSDDMMLPNWKDISPGRAGMPDCRIRLYGIGWSHGTPGFLKARLLSGKKVMRAISQVTKGSAAANNASKDPCALGLGSPSDAPLGTRIMGIGSFHGFVLPTESSVVRGTYPLTRGLYLYVNGKAGRPANRNAMAFARYVLGKEGQAAFLGQPFLALQAENAKKELFRLESPSI